MKALALVPGTTDVRLIDRPEPEITGPQQVKLRVLEVGICGTDREEAAGGRADAPPGQRELVIGHEMLGRVAEVGTGVRSVSVGDLALFSVRRGCGRCPACAVNRSDMCYTGDYTERGIKGRDGYETEYVVDEAQYLVRLNPAAEPFGVLTEPMSVAEKAIDEALKVQVSRLPDAGSESDWLRGRHTLIAGLGPVGLLAAFALRLRGAEVIGLDIVDRDSARVELLERVGGSYVDGREATPETLATRCPDIELIFEATGVAHLEFELLEALGRNGAYVLTGIPGGDRPIDIAGAELVRKLVLANQVMIGSVNASPQHFALAVSDLQAAHERWGDAIERVITARVPYTEFQRALARPSGDEIKTVVSWQDQSLAFGSP